MGDERAVRYGDERSVYAGIEGELIEIRSANPRNYHQAMTEPDRSEPITIDGKLFVPPGKGPRAAVIVVPGSLGVGPNHEMHAETLVGEGYAVLVVDPFAARAVTSTVSKQTHYSFAASAVDVVAAVRVLRERPEIDADRIAAQGHSRGGSAVTIAAHRPFAEATIGADTSLAAVYAVYPWCGHQFWRPEIGSTVSRAIIGDLDEWCSVQQVQGQAHALVAAGAEASLRVVPGAHHSFDRTEPVHTITDASVAPGAPTTYLDDDGAVLDLASGTSDPSPVDRDLFLAAIEGGFGRRGAAIGGVGDQPDLFRRDMLAFYAATIGGDDNGTRSAQRRRPSSSRIER